MGVHARKEIGAALRCAGHLRKPHGSAPDCAPGGRAKAGCVNLLGNPVESVYRWQGKVESAREWLLILKTTRARLSGLEREIRSLHSYEVPEFIALPIGSGSGGYLAWLADSVRRQA